VLHRLGDCLSSRREGRGLIRSVKEKNRTGKRKKGSLNRGKKDSFRYRQRVEEDKREREVRGEETMSRQNFIEREKVRSVLEVSPQSEGDWGYFLVNRGQ